jgi:hypothetical protein
LGAVFLATAMVELCAPASASEALPESGEAKLAAYQVCHPVSVVEMGAAGSESATECEGIVKNLGGQGPDNLGIRCLENGSTRGDGHKYSGACVQTDSDGDKLFMTYDGSVTGQVKWIGGTGKYKNVSGEGSLSVTVAPRIGPNRFAYTLGYDVNFTNKAK